MIDLKRVLVPTDLSTCSIAPTFQARQLAETFGAEIHVLFVLNESISMVPEPMAVMGLPDVMELREAMQESLAQWTSQHFGDSSRVEGVFRTGKDFVEILRYADEANIDLIVIGTHGSSGLEHALLGSVAERVVRRAPCPVLTVRPEAAAVSASK
jgi:universal stress protein A